jgi:hypothetical protein
MGFSYFFFVAKLSPESDLLRPQGSGSEVSDFISAGQAHNEEKLEEIISTCKLLRTCGKSGVGVCKRMQLSAPEPLLPQERSTGWRGLLKAATGVVASLP